MRRVLAMLLLVACAGGAQALQEEAPLPAARLPAPERRAVALEAGVIQSAADATGTVRTSFEAGHVFAYFGEQRDAFGRVWSIVGDPQAWRRQQTWLALPEGFSREVEPGDTLAFLTTLGTPAASGATRRAVRVPEGWWREPRPLTLIEPPQPGELLGVPAYRVPPELIDELLALAGGLEALGPWPANPVRGQIHVGTTIPLVFFWNGEWELGPTPRTLAPVLGLLGNPQLIPDEDGPTELTGLHVGCWTLTGAIDVGGLAVGEVDDAPEEPDRVPGAARGVDPLGAADLTRLGWPVADEEATAPRRVLLQEFSPGVLLEDNSARQAVILEQSLEPHVVALLRGRTLRLSVRARAVPQSETTSSVSVGIELQAGESRASTSAAVGVRSTPLAVELEIPVDATTITVRLLPQDLSIAVAERGSAIFDSASLAPLEWPDELTPDPLSLRRTLVVAYEPVRAYTRTPLAVTERPATELAATYPLLGDRSVERRQLILGGDVTAGMTPEEVRLAWGEAPETVPLDGGQRWDWPDRSAAFVGEGLKAWTRRPVATTERAAACGTGGATP